jgi:hypothetical protein
MTVHRAFGAWIAAVVLAALGLLVGVLVLANPLRLGGGSAAVAKASLQRSIPPADDGHGRFVGLTRAAEQQLAAGSLSGIRIVSENDASTGPSVVSVHPIDDYQWGAAAYSTDDGRCYVILVTVDQSDTRYGYTNFGVLPKGERCVGSAADASTATLGQWPA